MAIKIRNKWGYLILLSLFFVSCSVDNSDYFNGQIYTIDDCTRIDSLRGEKVEFDSLYTGLMHVSDSLVFFYVYNNPDYFILAFNHMTGKHITNFMARGNGNNEFVDLSGCYHTYDDNGRRKGVFYSAIKQSIILADITKIGDDAISHSTVKLKWQDKYKEPYADIYYLSDNIFLVRVQDSYMIIDNEKYRMRTFNRVNTKTGEIEKTYNLFNKPILNKTDSYYLHWRDYYELYYSLNPRKDKLASAMMSLSQINILDLETGLQKGFRIKGTPDFNDLSNNSGDFKIYYLDVASDDKYIYGLYHDEIYKKRQNTIPKSNIVNVFDWNGNFVRKINLEFQATNLKIDICNGYMITKDDATEDVYRYKL